MFGWWELPTQDGWRHRTACLRFRAAAEQSPINTGITCLSYCSDECCTMPSRRLFASSKTLIKAMPCLVLFRPVSYRSPISATPDIVPHLPIPCDPCTQQQQRQQCTAAASAAMRAAASQTPVLDGPSTSGRCLCSPTLVYTRRRGRIVLAQASHMPIGLHNTQPIPGFRPPTAEGVVKGYRTTATPRLTPERVRCASSRQPQITASLLLLLLMPHVDHSPVSWLGYGRTRWSLLVAGAAAAGREHP